MEDENGMNVGDMILQEDPVTAAIFHEDPDALENILQKEGALVNYHVQHTCKTPLLLAVGPKPVHTALARVLLDHGANVQEGETAHLISPLMAACNVGNLELAGLLLDRNAQVNAQSADGKTALIQMARGGNLEVFELLLDRGADLTIYDEQAKNALMYACSENRQNIVRYLMSRPHNGVNDYKVDTPLWYAAAAGHAGIVKLLIEAGASVEYRTDGTIYSTTPLMEACEWGHLDVVKLLLQNGAEVASPTGRKALILARRAGYSEVVVMMEQWQKRLEALYRFVDEGGPAKDSIPSSLLPFILHRGGRRPDTNYRILRSRIGHTGGL